jgi:hypothetical protein
MKKQLLFVKSTEKINDLPEEELTKTALALDFNNRTNQYNQI